MKISNDNAPLLGGRWRWEAALEIVGVTLWVLLLLLMLAKALS